MAESLSTTAKKKKDIWIVAGIIIIIFLVLGSLAMSIGNVDKSKTFKGKDANNSDINKSKEAVNVLPSPDYKEAWAISAENRIKENEQKYENIYQKLKEDQQASQAEMNTSLSGMQNSINKLTEVFQTKTKEIATSMDLKFSGLKSYVENRFRDTDKRIDEASQNMNIKEIANMQSPDSKFAVSQNGLPVNDTSLNKRNQKTNTGNSPLDKAMGLNQQQNTNTKVVGGETKVEVSQPQNIQKKASYSIMDIVIPKKEDKKNNEQTNVEQIAVGKKTDKTANDSSYHIALGLTEATLVTGVYAPVIQAEDQENLPVLMQAKGDILIANDDSQSIDKCFILGSAKGNMNSETADIRLVSISCSVNGGEKIVEGGINGWVVGENSIPGVQGELLHKNGAWLANTFVAGFLQTFSNAFNRSSQTINIGGSTTQQPIATGQDIQNATAGGLSTVFGKLGDYYLKMASQIMPVVEVKAGRTVTILLKGGEDLSAKEFKKFNAATSFNTRYFKKKKGSN